MTIQPECYPCFLHQGLNIGRILNLPQAVQRKLMGRIAGMLASLDEEALPPLIGGRVFRLVRDLAGIPDPFREIKRRSNRALLKMYPRLKRDVRASADPLGTALTLAAAGNTIDYGIAGHSVHVVSAEHLRKQPAGVWDLEAFRERLERARSILFIVDNAGEIVLDRILIEQMAKDVTCAVRESPILNDALIEDARMTGLTSVCRVISSGSSDPGILLSRCSPEFLDLYRNSDLIISKGQGNYESLDGERGNIFFLLKAKCPVVARKLQCNLGDLVLLDHGHSRKGAGHPARASRRGHSGGRDKGKKRRGNPRGR